MMAPVLPPPDKFLPVPGEPPQVPWKVWIDYFELYYFELTQGRQTSEPDEEKTALLCRYLGNEGLRIYNSLSPTETYEASVEALTDHFNTDPPGPPQKQSRKGAIVAVAVAAAAVTGVTAVALAPVALAAAGFTAAGVTAGSFAASMMSAAAVANGGGIAAGSVVALLQSAGAVGLSGAATAAVGGVGASVGALAGGAVGWLTSKIREIGSNKK